MKVLALSLLLVACHKDPAPPAAPPPPALKIHAPSATGGTATVTGAPPLLVFVDEHSKVSIAAGPTTWAALATFDPKDAKPISDREDFRKQLLEATDRHFTPQQIVDNAGTVHELQPDVGALAEVEAESGGAGTAMALEEGKMGKTDTDKKPAPRVVPHPGTGPLGDQVDQRHVAIVGKVLDTPRPAIAIVLADPHAPAPMMIDMIRDTLGFIGVVRDGAIAPLRLQLDHSRDAVTPEEDPPSIEIRVHASSLELAGKPVAIAGLGPAYAAAKRDPHNPVDVVVDRDVDSQHLVDVLVALDQAGARTIGLGAAK